MARRSRTHEVAHFKQDNGELQRTVAPRDLVEPDDEETAGQEPPSRGESPYPPHDDPDKRIVSSEPLEDKASPED